MWARRSAMTCFPNTRDSANVCPTSCAPRSNGSCPISGARKTLGLPSSMPVVLCATRLSRENAVDVVLRAAALLTAQLPDFQLHIVGDGPEWKALRGLANDLGIGDHTIWHGWVDLYSLPLYYSAADVFVFAGCSGGTPRVLLQAMACGTAVVASRIGGIVDHVREGVTGLLFTVGCPDELAHQIKTLLQCVEQRWALGLNAYSYVRSSVDWDLLANRIRKVYLKVTSEALDGLHTT
ncbi:MAG: glycosyltransferase family 4 protein [Anaerolineae bacterium]